MHGWDLPTAQGASLQLKQMFARQQITAADANLLTGYGINVYQTLADALGKDVKDIRKQGERQAGPEIHSDGIQNAVRTVKRCTGQCDELLGRDVRPDGS